MTQLRAFHLVADAGSFSLAARTAGLSQPTLSAQVRALEASYAVDLFDRRGRGVRMTPTGQSLFTLTTRLIAAEEEARALLTGGRALTRGHLRVSADSAYHVMPILAELKRTACRPDLHAEDRQLGGRARSPDRARRRRRGDGEDDVRPEHLFDEAARGPAGAVSSRRIIPGRAGGASAWPNSRAATSWCASAARSPAKCSRQGWRKPGVVSKSLIEVQTREAVREAVAAGFGIGVVFDSEFGTDARFHAIEVSDTDLSVGEYVVCLQERRRLAVVRAFLDVARDIARGSSTDP